ncbi:MAG TPA: hypothetical protein VGC56_11985 [Allosphingosinicella sp.]|jgi:hypothetical protein
MGFAFAPLSKTLPSWPSAFGEPGGLLDEIGVTGLESFSDETSLRFIGKLAWLEEIELKLPGLDAASIALLSAGSFTEVDFELQALPAFKLILPNLNATLRLRSPILRRVKLQSGKWNPDLDTGGAARPVEIGLNGVAASITGEGDISVSTAGMGLSLSSFEIGTTGLIVDATNAGLHLNAADPPPPGAQPGFKGVSIAQASLHLTASLAGGAAPDTVTLTDVLIGSSGFSGRVAATWAPNNQSKLFGMDCELIELAIDFRQNAPVGGGIKARIKLPFFDKPVDVEIGYTADGALTVGLGAANGGLATLSIQNVLDLELDALKFTVDDGVLTVGLSGMIIPRLQALKVPPIRVDNLTIDSKGNVNLPGGWLELPSQYALDFHSFKISITKFGMGREPDGRKWIGFSGGIKLVDGLPAGVSVDGLRISCKEDWSDPKVSLQGVGVELEIKDVLYFKGAVAYREPNPGESRFDGSIKLELKSLKFKLDGEFVVGNTQTYRYMALYIGVDLPTGLPLLSTGLAVFGMEGLFALRMAPNKKPTEPWYALSPAHCWYKDHGSIGVLPFADKWDPVPVGKAFGAGFTFGTLSDNGHTFSARALFVGIFPGPIFMIDGAANLLKDRSKLGDDPLFRSLAIYDGKAGSLLVGLDISYKYDATGKLIKLSAGTEAYYEFANPKAWRINLGLKTPTEQRIQARLFSMFDANAYLMLNARQVAMGCWVGYDKKWKFGPLGVALSAWMESNVVVSFKPMQFYGDMALHGGVELNAFGFGFNLTVDARVEAEIFHPKHLLAELDVTLNLPAPLPKKKRRLTAHCRIEYGPTPDPPPIPVALKGVSIEHLKVSTTWPLRSAPEELLQPVYDDGQGFLLDSPVGDMNALPTGPIPVVPLDCRPSLHFTRDVHDEAKVGAVVQLPDPEWEWIGDPEKKQGSARIRYALTSVLLDKRTPSGWQTVAGKGEGVSGLPPLFGTWGPAAAPGGPGVAQNRLTLWSKCGFDSFRNTGLDYADWFAGEFGGLNGYPCVPTPSEMCLDFRNVPLGARDSPFTHPDHPGVTFSCPQPGPALPPRHMIVRQVSDWGERTLCSNLRDSIDISFAKGVGQLRIRILYYANMAPPEVTATGRGGSRVPPSSEESLTPAEGMHVLIIRFDSGSVRAVHIGPGLFCLAELCGSFGPGTAQIEATSHNQTAIGLWSDEGKVLEPYTIYRLRIATRMTVTDFKHGGTVNGDHDAVQAAFFRTEGPPSLVTLSTPLDPPNASADRALDDLGLYVAQTAPPTVPPRGQPPILPRPVYRAYDVGVDFNEDYVDLMYRLAGRDLALILYDRNNKPVRERNGSVAVAENPWGVAEALGLTETETRWLALIDGSSCVPDVDRTQIPKDLTLAAPAEVLAPDTLYQARLTPLLLHEDFARIESGTGRWNIHDFASTGGPSAWSIAHSTNPAASNLAQTGGIGTAGGGAASLGTAAVLGPDPRAPAEGPASWTDYRLSAWLQSQTGGSVGLAFRWAGPGDFHLFAMDGAAGRRLYRVAGGVVTLLAQDPMLFAQNRSYQAVIEAIGGTIRIWVEGESVFDVEDPAAPTSGTVALHCSGTSTAFFSDVRVHDLSKAAKSAYGFSFTTSRFVNFLHHVHSHDDDAWPGPCTLSAPDFSAVAGTAVPALGTPVGDDEARAFEALAENLLGPRARQEAPRTETYRVEAAEGEVLGLFVRSPEPFDFSRLSLTLLQVANDAPASIAPAKVKLIGAILGATTPADEQVTLLVRETTNLTGWRLQKRDPAVADSAPWETIFEFGTEGEMRDATLVRIHSGNAAGGPGDNARRLERYRAPTNDPGDLKLAGDQADLQLVDRDGRVEHRRCFFRDALYAPIGVKFLRKADGTALALLPTAPLPPGALRLAFVYRKDNRIALPGSIVLTEAGDRAPEAVAIDIPTLSPI